jgi:hypothetical protein
LDSSSTKVLLADDFSETPGARMTDECSENQDGQYLTTIESVNLLQQYPHRTDVIESIESYIRPPWWMLKAKTRIEDIKDIAKRIYAKT